MTVSRPGNRGDAQWGPLVGVVPLKQLHRVRGNNRVVRVFLQQALQQQGASSQTCADIF